MNIAYVRVSTAEQNEGRQVAALEACEIDKWYVEKVSAKDLSRPELQTMLDFAREGDVIYIKDFSRIARSTADLLKLAEDLQSRGIRLVSLKENLDTSTPTGKLLVTMIAAIYEFERSNLLERQREGIALARQRGAYGGRKPVTVEAFPAHYERLQRGETTKTALARELGISRPTLDKLIAQNAEGG